MKVGDKFYTKEGNGTIEIVDKYFNPLYGEVVYDLKFIHTNTTLHGILRKTIMDLVRRGLAVSYGCMEPLKYVKRLELHQ